MKKKLLLLITALCTFGNINQTKAQAGAALNFDGSSNYIDVGTLNLTSYTKEAWIYANASGSCNIISSNQSPFWLSGGQLSAINGFGGGTVIQDPATFVLNVWTHVAVTYDNAGGTLTLYKNGVQVAQSTSEPAYVVEDISIGQYGNGNYFAGSMDEVRIWNYARTACQINAAMNCELAASKAGLVLYYKFNQGTANANNTPIIMAADSSGNGNDGVLNNFVLNGTTSNWVAPGAVTSDVSCSFVLGNLTVNPTSVLVGITTTLTASGASSYTWSTNETTPSIVVTPTTNVGYTVTGSDGTCTNTVAVSIQGAALNFDGVDDNVSIPNNAVFNITDAITIESWIKTTGSPTNEQYIVTKNENSYYVALNVAGAVGQAGFYLDGVSSSWLYTNSNTLNDNNWHHIACTYDGSTMSIYVDGVLDNSIAITGTINTGIDNVYLGCRDNNQFFQGSMDEFRIWNRALCAVEIQNNLNGEIAKNSNGLVAYYKFNQGFDNTDNTAITTLADSSSNALNGSFNNFALIGSTSNFVAPGAVTTGSYVPVYAAPTLTVTGSNTACVGQTAVLTASGVTTYTWSNGSATDTTNINNPVGTYTYSVIGTDASGCLTIPTSVTVTVNALPVINNASGNSHTCEGGTAVYNVTSDNPTTDTYQWNWIDVTTPSVDNTISGLYNESGYTTNSMTISPMQSSVWGPSGAWGVHCAVTNTAGCTAESVIDTLFINPIPTAVTGGGAICLGQSFTVTVSGVTSYTLTGGNSVITPTATTSYTLTGTDGNGCVSSPSVITVTVNPLPTVSVTPTTTVLCNGSLFSVTIQAGGANTYSWSTGVTTNTIAINGTGIVATITVTVTGTDGNGCQNNASATIDEQTCLGIENYTNNVSVSIYPNPSKGEFTIETSNYTNNTVLTIYNSIGELVYTTTLHQQVETLNTKLASGMYTVRLQNAQGAGVQHIIIAN